MTKLITKKRVNVSVSSEIEELLKKLAKRDEVPVATKALELIKKAIQIEEDDVLDMLAEKRDVKNAKYLSREAVWR